MLIVSTTHKVETWQLNNQPFALVEQGEWDREYRVGGDHANGYYAIATNFGCGKTRATPQEAIRHLMYDNGCTSVRLD